MIRNHPLLSFEDAYVNTSELAANVDPSVASVPAGAATSSRSVAKTRLPKISVTGLVISPRTGKLDLVSAPDKETEEFYKKVFADTELAKELQKNSNANSTAKEATTPATASTQSSDNPSPPQPTSTEKRAASVSVA